MNDLKAISATSQLDEEAGTTAYASGHVRVGPAMALQSLLEEFGARPQKAFAMSGVSPLAFADANNRIPYLLFGSLLDSCVL